MFIIFWYILIDEQIFFSPQVKRNVIISDKYGIYKLLHELPNNLRLRILGSFMLTALSSLGGLSCPHKTKKT